MNDYWVIYILIPPLPTTTPLYKGREREREEIVPISEIFTRVI
jgi:hypothetical protein